MLEKQLKLNAGDIVHLNSGSPDLKIAAIENGKVTVEWHGESGLEQATLPVVCVRRVK